MKLFINLLLCISSLAYGQQSVTGVIIAHDTQKPIPYATVYINGTTNGSTSNSQGVFELNDITYPSLLVISHLSYQKKIIELRDSNQTIPTIQLENKENILHEVKVDGQNKRMQNIARFKKDYLGRDELGMSAILHNDSVLSFHRELINNRKLKLDSSITISLYKETYFSACASAPLRIDLPKLGYKLHADLIDFSIENIGCTRRTTSLGLYYFQPYPQEKKERKRKKIEKQRRLAYYNSSQHFCRSLFSKTLSENGYELLHEVINDSTNASHYETANIDSFLTFHDDNVIISGIKDTSFLIMYYYQRNGSPCNITIDGKSPYHLHSNIFFLQDTCYITQNGIIPNSDILFNGSISEKKVGAILPTDYTVPLKE